MHIYSNMIDKDTESMGGTRMVFSPLVESMLLSPLVTSGPTTAPPSLLTPFHSLTLELFSPPRQSLLISPLQRYRTPKQHHHLGIEKENDEEEEEKDKNWKNFESTTTQPSQNQWSPPRGSWGRIEGKSRLFSLQYSNRQHHHTRSASVSSGWQREERTRKSVITDVADQPEFQCHSNIIENTHSNNMSTRKADEIHKIHVSRHSRQKSCPTFDSLTLSRTELASSGNRNVMDSRHKSGRSMLITFPSECKSMWNALPPCSAQPQVALANHNRNIDNSIYFSSEKRADSPDFLN